MKTANKLIAKGQGLAAPLLKRAPTVELDWDTRQKSRFECKTADGDAVGVFLPRGTVLRGGDVLVCDDGSLLKIQSSAQSVLRITPCAAHGSSFDLMRAAYHLGNRHVGIELHPEHLQIEPDHVLADMLRAMHLDVVALEAAFEPESGAYASAHAHPHASEPAPPRKPIAIAVAAAPHVHGPNCNHGHEHD